jgi:hypothetical protein
VSTSEAGDLSEEVATFSQCVIGYRAWAADHDGQLWPLSSQRRPWNPGVNTARCNCDSRTSLKLRFECSRKDGRLVLESAPEHVAPEVQCECGLYSWRRPRSIWRSEPQYRSAEAVCGAVASWGRLLVHADGFRAEHACVVTLAYPQGASRGAIKTLTAIAARYRVELVPLAELGQAASRHGAPLPDSLRPSTPPATEDTVDAPLDQAPTPRAPDMTVEEFEDSGRRLPVRKRHLGAIAAVLVVALIAALFLFDHRSKPCHLQIVEIPGALNATEEQCATSANHNDHHSLAHHGSRTARPNSTGSPKSPAKARQ